MMSTLSSILALFILIAIGYFLGTFKILSDKAEKDLSKLLILIITPATIINSMAIPFDMDILISAGQVFIYAFSFQIVGIIFGVILSKILKLHSTERPIYIIALMIANVGNMGIPVISAIMGEEYIFFISIVIMCNNIILYTFGMFIMMSDSGEKVVFKDKLLELIKVPPVIATIIGLSIFIFEIPLPELVSSTLETLAAVMTPIAMIIVGMILTHAPVKNIFNNLSIYILVLFKLLIMPLLMMLVCILTGLDKDLSQFLVLITAMPSAAMTVILSTRYDKNKVFASQIVFLTTLLTVITIPLLTVLTEYVWF